MRPDHSPLSEELWGHICSLIPKAKSGTPDASWIRAPFDRIVIISKSDDSPLCFLVTSYDKKRHPDRFDDAGDVEWRAVVDVIAALNNGDPIGLVSTSSFKAKSDGTVWHWNSDNVDIAMTAILDRARDLGLHPTGAELLINHADGLSGMLSYVRTVPLSVLALLSCKNVNVVERQASRQVRRAAERAGLPMVSWHELIVGRGSGSGGTGSGDEHNALHWVRGHFKDYRKAGVFGKAKGVYWWSPHLAGQADRVVLKGYAIEDPDTNPDKMSGLAQMENTE
jgi:hypothetical protein